MSRKSSIASTAAASSASTSAFAMGNMAAALNPDQTKQKAMENIKAIINKYNVELDEKQKEYENLLNEMVNIQGSKSELENMILSPADKKKKRADLEKKLEKPKKLEVEAKKEIEQMKYELTNCENALRAVEHGDETTKYMDVKSVPWQILISNKETRKGHHENCKHEGEYDKCLSCLRIIQEQELAEFKPLDQNEEVYKTFIKSIEEMKSKFKESWEAAKSQDKSEEDKLVDRYINVISEFGSKGFINQVLTSDQGEVGYDVFLLCALSFAFPIHKLSYLTREKKSVTNQSQSTQTLRKADILATLVNNRNAEVFFMESSLSVSDRKKHSKEDISKLCFYLVRSFITKDSSKRYHLALHLYEEEDNDNNDKKLKKLDLYSVAFYHDLRVLIKVNSVTAPLESTNIDEWVQFFTFQVAIAKMLNVEIEQTKINTQSTMMFSPVKTSAST